MKVKLLCLSMLFLSVKTQAQTTISVFDEVLFYDGYAAVVTEPVPTGVIRHRNDLYATKLSETQLASFGSQVTMNVTIKAACDNYDRIGNVNLALVPKGSSSYTPDSVERIEVGRYITPFMNKNVMPNEVPYTYTVNNLGAIFKDQALNNTYDFWVELEVFGVPYAANTQVAGCSGRNDVFYGSLDFVTSGTITPNTYLLPLSMKANFNNYQEGASDAIGTTVKTISFELNQAVNDATFYLITSNHGANSGGEEYVRRWHYVKFDGAEVLSYRPGGKSCEPYRQYNTQGNGIYQGSPQTETWWTNWNNWCPGDTIPIRRISLGNLTAGTHTFEISVPQAVFNQQQGNIPLSLYLQGTKTAIVGLDEVFSNSLKIYPNPSDNVVYLNSQNEIKEVTILDASGKIIGKHKQSTIDISQIQAGIYFLEIEFSEGIIVTKKIVKN